MMGNVMVKTSGVALNQAAISNKEVVKDVKTDTSASSETAAAPSDTSVDQSSTEVTDSTAVNVDESQATATTAPVDETAVTDESTVATDETATASEGTASTDTVIADDAMAKEAMVKAAAGGDVVAVNPGGDQGMLDPTMTGTVQVKEPLMASWPFVCGISAAVLFVSIVLGVLLARRKIKKGIELYED